MKNLKKEIDRWRGRIDKIDLQIVKLLNKRAKCAEEIGKRKLKIGIKAYAPEREKKVMRNVTRANAGPLSMKSIKQLFNKIIVESRSVERDFMHTKVSGKSAKRRKL